MIVIPRTSRATLLAMLLNKTVAEELDLHVYKNDYTPNDDTELADFIEANFAGYAAEQLDSAVYAITVPGPGTSIPASAEYDDIEFASSAEQAANNNYGYYVTRRITGDLLWCERFSDGPYTIATADNKFTINPRFRLAAL